MGSCWLQTTVLLVTNNASETVVIVNVMECFVKLQGLNLSSDYFCCVQGPYIVVQDIADDIKVFSVKS